MRPLSLTQTFTSKTAHLLYDNTGFNEEEIVRLAHDFHCRDLEALTLGLCVVHQDVSNNALPTIHRGLFGGDDTMAVSTLWGRVERELMRHFMQPMLTQLHRRFELADEFLPNVVFLLDGTTIDVRMHESQKGHKGYNANFQVLHDVSGELMTYAGPFSGRLPDNRNFNKWESDTLRVNGFCDPRCITELSFPHGRHELILADGIYKANVHCMVPYEGVPDQPQPTAARQLRTQMCYNRHAKIVRSRVERRYSALKSHNLVQRTDRTITTIALLWRLLWNAEMVRINLKKERGQPSSAVDELCDGRGRDFGDCCTCNWSGMWYAGHPERDSILAYRDAYREYIWGRTNGVMRISHISAHASKSRKMTQQQRIANGETLQF